MPRAVNEASSPPVAGPSLELGLIGNCTFNALVDSEGGVVWCCMPRPDSDPILHALLGTTGVGANGRFTVDVADRVETRQRYVPNTAILETELLGGFRPNALVHFERCHDAARLFFP
jgi:hypothetical protein